MSSWGAPSSRSMPWPLSHRRCAQERPTGRLAAAAVAAAAAAATAAAAAVAAAGAAAAATGMRQARARRAWDLHLRRPA
jgi:hypothetical protein